LKNKKSVTLKIMEPLKAIEVRRVESSAELMKPGDYTYIAKREPVRRIETLPIPPPRQFFKRLAWRIWGRKELQHEVIELRWPDYDAIILNCPNCNQPIATTAAHKIISVEPLTISVPIACGYEKAQGVARDAREQERASNFEITGGRIIRV